MPHPWPPKTDLRRLTSTRHASSHIWMSHHTCFRGHQRRVRDARDQQDTNHVTDEWVTSRASVDNKNELVKLDINKIWVTSRVNELRHIPLWTQKTSSWCSRLTRHGSYHRWMRCFTYLHGHQRRVRDARDRQDMSRITHEWVTSRTSMAPKTSCWHLRSKKHESHHVWMSSIKYLRGHQRRVSDARDRPDTSCITDEWVTSRTSVDNKNELVKLEIWDHITCKCVTSRNSVDTQDSFVTLEIDKT